MQKKKVTLAKFNDRAEKGRNMGIATKKANAKNDGLTTQERRKQIIKKAANGKWWIEQYIAGSMTFNEKE